MLDSLFSADVIGEGTNNVVWPFQATQSQLYRGQVIPIYTGWLGEIGEDFEEVIKILA